MANAFLVLLSRMSFQVLTPVKSEGVHKRTEVPKVRRRVRRPIGDILPAPLQPTWTWADMHQMPHRIDDLGTRMPTGSELIGKPEVIGFFVGLVPITALVFTDAVSL